MRHEHDTHTFDSGTKLRVMGDAILVMPDDPPEETSTGIIYASGAMEHAYNTGTILAFGTTRDEDGNKEPISGLEVGRKVYFVRFLAEQESNTQIRHMYEGVIRIKTSDAILVFDEEDRGRIG